VQGRKYMETEVRPGDLVQKLGDSDVGKLGLVLSSHTNSLMNTIVTVLASGKIKKWYKGSLRLVYPREENETR
jgi:hypothetical protein